MTEVVDGDTIEVTDGRRVRFLGIDACEMSTRGGREAKEYLKICRNSSFLLTAA